MLPAAPILDEMGFSGLETWGGATIDSCLRYLEREPLRPPPRAQESRAQDTADHAAARPEHRAIREFPGRRGGGLRPCRRQPPGRTSSGFSTRSTTSATSPPRSRRCIDCGKHARGEICYTTSPVHTIEGLRQHGRRVRRNGLPFHRHQGHVRHHRRRRVAHDLVKELKGKLGIPIVLHTHDTAGLGAAVLSGRDRGRGGHRGNLDRSRLPTAPASRTPLRMLALLDGHPRRPDYDPDEAPGTAPPLRGASIGSSPSSPARPTSASIRTSSCFQVPGGMLSNFRNQLAEQGMADKFDEVVREIPVVREALGWIPLVTPTSQIVGTQAMMNIKFGRWKMICQPAQDIALGKYGKAPGPDQPGDPRTGGETDGRQGRHLPARPICWNPASMAIANNARTRVCRPTTRSPCSSPCFRNRSRRSSRACRAAEAAKPATLAPRRRTLPAPAPAPSSASPE